ncbi:hypothetical protein AB1Y20_007348 [Prymnesium parvum]|uniref:DNA topoisomerase n=1 Tax=Prymnesium parvum TaxID=97485 RepID=A0AB34IV64_PRYPA
MGGGRGRGGKGGAATHRGAGRAEVERVQGRGGGPGGRTAPVEESPPRGGGGSDPQRSRGRADPQQQGNLAARVLRMSLGERSEAGHEAGAAVLALVAALEKLGLRHAEAVACARARVASPLMEEVIVALRQAPERVEQLAEQLVSSGGASRGVATKEEGTRDSVCESGRGNSGRGGVGERGEGESGERGGDNGASNVRGKGGMRGRGFGVGQGDAEESNGGAKGERTGGGRGAGRVAEESNAGAKGGKKGGGRGASQDSNGEERNGGAKGGKKGGGRGAGQDTNGEESAKGGKKGGGRGGGQGGAAEESNSTRNAGGRGGGQGGGATEESYGGRKGGGKVGGRDDDSVQSCSENHGRKRGGKDSGAGGDGETDRDGNGGTKGGRYDGGDSGKGGAKGGAKGGDKRKGDGTGSERASETGEGTDGRRATARGKGGTRSAELDARSDVQRGGEPSVGTGGIPGSRANGNAKGSGGRGKSGPLNDAPRVQETPPPPVALRKVSAPPPPPLKADGSAVVLHVAEKPSIALAIATALSGKGGKGMGSRSSGICPVHEFTSLPFPTADTQGEVRCSHRVTSVVGHVFSLDFHAKYQNWDATSPAELFGATTVRKPTKVGVVKHLEREAKGADVLVLWLDCDREGENIAFEVIECTLASMRHGGHMERVYRAKFSAIGEKDILKAYRSLGRPNKAESDAVDELDLKVGVAFSRYQTRYFQGRYADLNSEILSYGPCQTPTLGFCVRRHVDIETFVPKAYWRLELTLAKDGRRVRCVSEAGRLMDRSKAERRVAAAVGAEGAAVRVVDVTSRERKEGRPLPLNTVALLKACSKSLGIGPASAMHLAESLYLSGAVSYPRTESTAYPASFDLREAVSEQSRDPRWGAYAQELLRGELHKPRGGVDRGDHPPITPCRACAPHEHGGDLGRVYELVVRHFLATLSADAVWRAATMRLEVTPTAERFVVRTKTLQSPGFMRALADASDRYYEEEEMEEYLHDRDEAVEEEREMPELRQGDVIRLAGAEGCPSGAVANGSATLSLKEGVTSPPPLLSESDLISLMERHGIGTDASIPTHIENVIKRNYVELVSGRRLRPSRLGVVLAQGYHAIDSTLVLPDVRADIERQCLKIAEGKAEKGAVVRAALESFERRFHHFVSHIERMDVLFASSFAKLEDAGRPYTRCGLTRRFLTLIEGPPRRLYNRYTETIYPLPKGGNVKQWSGQVCREPGCNFELLLYSVGNPQRTFPLCPYCFNHPKSEGDPEEGEGGSRQEEGEHDEASGKNDGGSLGASHAWQLVLHCPLPDAHPCIAELTVAEDEESGGVYILDPASCGQHWRFVSTRAPTIIKLPNNIHKVTVLKKVDEETGCHYIEVDFRQGESPLDGDKTKHVGLIYSDPLLTEMTHFTHGSERLAGKGRGKGKGRGRGRGGKGRGRASRIDPKMTFDGF